MWRLVACCLLAAPAAAQVSSVGPGLQDMLQSRPLGMAAFEAMGYGAEAVVGNPAAITLYKRYQIELSGAYDIPSGYGLGGLSLADSASSQLGAGVSYQFATYGKDQRRWAHVTTAASAISIADLFHIGIAVKNHVITGATKTTSITMNAGLIFRPVNGLTFGFSGHNLIPNYNQDITRYFVASAAVQLFGQLTPAFDLKMDFNGPTPRLSYQGGIEWLIAMMFPVRAGYTHDNISGHKYLSFGIGYFDEGSGIDLSYRHELGGDGGELLSLTAKMQL